MPNLENEEFLKQNLELKDIPYKLGYKEFGYSGHKIESSYSDGSAYEETVLSIPNIDALKMSLKVGGFDNITTSIDSKDYGKIFTNSHRQFSAVCITCEKLKISKKSINFNFDYETGMICTTLPENFTRELYQRTLPTDKSILIDSFDKILYKVNETFKNQNKSLDLTKRFYLEIISSLKHSPLDKVTFEMSKILILEKEFEIAKKLLLTITTKINADWRTVYRSFCLLNWILKNEGKLNEAKRYFDLCILSNPNFPKELLEADIKFLKPIEI